MLAALAETVRRPPGVTWNTSAAAAHDDALPLAAGEAPAGIWVYQNPCKALQRLVTEDGMQTPQVRQCNANDRFRTLRYSTSRNGGSRLSMAKLRSPLVAS